MISRTALCLALILVSLIPSGSLGRQHQDIFVAKTYDNQRGGTMPYRLFVPDKYDSKKPYPLVLYLHGGGGLGTNNLNQLLGGNAVTIELFVNAESQVKHPCFVVAPQSNGKGWVEGDPATGTSQLRLVLELVDSLLKDYSIDRRRVYVAGQSLGGFGTFAIISERPSLFAAAVPICGGGDESKAERIADLPIWAFHGEKDESVSVDRSRKMIAALKRARGKPRYTEYPGEGHVIMRKVVKEPELLTWIFDQKRTR